MDMTLLIYHDKMRIICKVFMKLMIQVPGIKEQK